MKFHSSIHVQFIFILYLLAQSDGKNAWKMVYELKFWTTQAPHIFKAKGFICLLSQSIMPKKINFTTNIQRPKEIT